jgi:hypothetical protein
METRNTRTPSSAPDRDAKTRSRDTLKHFVAYGLIIIFSGIALMAGDFIELRLVPERVPLEHLSKLAAELLTELGIAGVIACVLAFTIERFSAKEFAKVAEKERREVAKDVFDAMLGHSIPRSIKDEMSTQILAEPLIRKKLVMTYVLTPLADSETPPRYVFVDFEMSYEIHNLSSCKRPFRLKSAFPKPPIPSLLNLAKFTKIKATGFCQDESSDEATSVLLKGEEIQTYENTGSHVSLKYPNVLWVSPDRPTMVEIHSQTVKHLAGASSYFTVEYHTTDFKLGVQVSGVQLNVHAGASPVSRDSDWLKMTGECKEEEWLRIKALHPSQGFYEWESQRPLLAFQALWVTWNPAEFEGQE